MGAIPHRRAGAAPPGAGIFTRPIVALMLGGGIWSAAVNPGLTIVAQALRVADHIVDTDLT